MRLLRSPREILDRSVQEIRNLILWAAPGRARLTAAPALPLRGLRDPHTVVAELRGTEWEREVLELAARIRAHRFPLLGIEVATGPEIRWRRDCVSGRETGLEYFRRVPYLDAGRAGDHKVIWELNRHQHLVVLAQAFLFSGEQANLDEIEAQWGSWFEANPFQRGINWASALEVAFRALSWIWVYHLVGDKLTAGLRDRFLERLYQHGLHLEVNLSFYFSPNTHLLGEAVALHAIGAVFPEYPRAGKWVELGGGVVERQMEVQVRADGAHFEQSTYYHVYALDMFQFHALLGSPSAAYRAKLEKMREFLHAVMGPSRRLPLFGDDDGGRFFHPYGRHSEYGRMTLDGNPWWTAERLAPVREWRSKLFPDIGLAVIVHDDIHVVVDVGPFGPWSSGHSHSDTLSLTVRVGREDVLIDSGTYTYVGDPVERDRFRGSAAHNTIRIDGRDQAVPGGPFGWSEQPAVRILGFTETSVEGECGYGGFIHRRSVRLDAAVRRLVVEDEVTGPAGERLVEQFWRPAGPRIHVEGEEVDCFVSDALGEKHSARAIRVVRKGPLPMRLSTTIQL